MHFPKSHAPIFQPKRPPLAPAAGANSPEEYFAKGGLSSPRDVLPKLQHEASNPTPTVCLRYYDIGWWSGHLHWLALAVLGWMSGRPFFRLSVCSVRALAHTYTTPFELSHCHTLCPTYTVTYPLTDARRSQGLTYTFYHVSNIRIFIAAKTEPPENGLCHQAIHDTPSTSLEWLAGNGLS